jgi:hypothetical protein
MVVGWTIFTNTGKNIVYLIYLWYFKDHEMVDNFAWGDVAGYMTMFQPNLYYYLVN